MTSTTLWLRALEPEGVSLWRVSGAEVERSAGAMIIHGPIYDGERWLALMDGALHEYGLGWDRIGEVDWTCLRSLGDREFACSLVAMQELGGVGVIPTTTPVFSMVQLGPPRACGDEPAQRACESEWVHFGGEPGWLDTLPATSPTGERRVPSSGCSIGPLSFSRLGFPFAPCLIAMLALGIGRR